MRLAVTYDISEDKIRTRVFKILERYGAWRQYSVFELEINDIQRLNMENEIKAADRGGRQGKNISAMRAMCGQHN